MSQTNVAITQLVQVGLAERMAQEAQAYPEVARQVAQQAAPEALRQQNAMVAKTDETEESRKIKAQDKGGQKPGADARKRKKRGHHAQPEEAENTSAQTPWAGNIVNIKV